ncbi:TerB family tellurite resistance protein [Celeribacter halophilus]|uniref:tellurite resistance TerB family protein n=1 Tax=Celeribacter halophilus TaxID=576117 RepID=UPI003A8F74D3
MFRTLKALFKKAEPYETPLPEADAQHAMGALLVRAAKADHKILFEELQVIDSILARRFGLNPVEASKMRAACEKLEKEMPETQEMTSIVRNAISMEERERTLKALWQVVYADGVNHEQEDVLLHHIEKLLGISKDRAKALQSEVRDG